MTMNRATDQVANDSQIFCRCGRDHRRAGSRWCPTFNIVEELRRHVRNFLNVRDVWDSGKDGPLAWSLCSKTIEYHGYATSTLEHWDSVSKEHPEWHLQEQISTLWEYVEQVADGCAEARKSLEHYPPASVVPKIIGDEKEALRDAKKATIECYDVFDSVIRSWIHDGACPLSIGFDDNGWLKEVDDAFKKAFEKIILLPDTENANIRDLTDKAYGSWKETRRLLCESKTRKMIP